MEHSVAPPLPWRYAEQETPDGTTLRILGPEDAVVWEHHVAYREGDGMRWIAMSFMGLALAAEREELHPLMARALAARASPLHARIDPINMGPMIRRLALHVGVKLP